MKIYDRPGFPNSSRIRIVLSEKGLDDRVEFVSVDLIGAEHKQAPFLAINPSGKIPVLELDDGTLISESTAITEYLDHLDGHPVLTGRTPREKAVIHMMQNRAEAELMGAVDGYFHYATSGLGPAMQPYVAPEWAGRKEWGERQRARFIRGMNYFDGVLKNTPFVAGDAFSMADITGLCEPGLRWRSGDIDSRCVQIPHRLAGKSIKSAKRQEPDRSRFPAGGPEAFWSVNCGVMSAPDRSQPSNATERPARPLAPVRPPHRYPPPSASLPSPRCPWHGKSWRGARAIPDR
jgi:glutathione S-transferase